MPAVLPVTERTCGRIGSVGPDRAASSQEGEGRSVEVGAAAERPLELAEVRVVAEGEDRVPQLNRFLALRRLVDHRPEEAGTIGRGEAEHRRADVAAAA